MHYAADPIGRAAVAVRVGPGVCHGGADQRAGADRPGDRVGRLPVPAGDGPAVLFDARAQGGGGADRAFLSQQLSEVATMRLAISR